MKCEWELSRPIYVTIAKATTAVFCALGIAMTLAVYDMHWLRPLLAGFAAAPTPEQTMPMRRLDPTCRLEGWQTLAKAVDEVRQQLRSEGDEPILAGANWFIPGEVAFFLPDHPTVYAVGVPMGDRESQFSLWRPNPVADRDAFVGKTFILIGMGPMKWDDAFRVGGTGPRRTSRRQVPAQFLEHLGRPSLQRLSADCPENRVIDPLIRGDKFTSNSRTRTSFPVKAHAEPWIRRGLSEASATFIPVCLTA
ncbi:MAG: hypothetical protein U0744_18505 [Gemmataceae bacterium]